MLILPLIRVSIQQNLLPSPEPLVFGRLLIMRNRCIAIVVIISVTMILLAGCFPGGAQNTVHRPAGFFSAVWHGWIAPLSLIVGLFNPAVRSLRWSLRTRNSTRLRRGKGSRSLTRHKGDTGEVRSYWAYRSLGKDSELG